MNSDRPTRFSAPLGSLDRGLFEIMSGASNLRLQAAAPAGYRDAEVLAEGSFVGRVPEVRVDQHRVRLFYRHTFRDLCFDWRAASAEVALSPLVPWDVLVRGGVSRLDADLSAVRLASLEISGGVSEALLRLPRPTGTVRVFVLGGVSQLGLSRPAGVPLEVSIHGGASGLQVDTLGLGAVGGGFHWETPGFAEAEGRYIIEIHGGLSDARIGSFGDDAASAASRTPTRAGDAFVSAAAR
jgi:hypothetical protein